MHPDILDALRLAMSYYPTVTRRRGYAFGGIPSADSFNPTTYYTPKATNSSVPSYPGQAANSGPSDNRNAAPGLMNNQTYNWSPLYPQNGSGTNIPHPSPPPGPYSTLGMSAPSSTLGAAPSYDWPLPYSGMGGMQGSAPWSVSSSGGSGLKNGPGAYNNTMSNNTMADMPPEDPTGDWT